MSKKRLINQATYAQGTADSAAPLPEVKMWDISLRDLQGERADLIELSEKGPFSALGLVQTPTEAGRREKMRIKIFPILEYSLDYPANSPCTVWIRTHDTWYHIQTIAKSYFAVWKRMLICTNLLGFLVHHMLASSNFNETKFEIVLERVAHSLKQSYADTFDQLVKHSDFIFFQLQQQNANQIVKSDFLTMLSHLLTGSSKNPLNSGQALEIIKQRRQHPGLNGSIGLVKRRAKRSNIIIELDSDSEMEGGPILQHKLSQNEVTLKKQAWSGNDHPCLLDVPLIDSIVATGTFQCIACPMLFVRSKEQTNFKFVQRIQLHICSHIESNPTCNKSCSDYRKLPLSSLNDNANIPSINWDFTSIPGSTFSDRVSPLLWESTGVLPQLPATSSAAVAAVPTKERNELSIAKGDEDILKLDSDDSTAE